MGVLRPVPAAYPCSDQQRLTCPKDSDGCSASYAGVVSCYKIHPEVFIFIAYVIAGIFGVTAFVFFICYLIQCRAKRSVRDWAERPQEPKPEEQLTQQ